MVIWISNFYSLVPEFNVNFDRGETKSKIICFFVQVLLASVDMAGVMESVGESPCVDALSVKICQC